MLLKRMIYIDELNEGLMRDCEKGQSLLQVGRENRTTTDLNDHFAGSRHS